jgi:hypothetical protein
MQVRCGVGPESRMSGQRTGASALAVEATTALLLGTLAPLWRFVDPVSGEPSRTANPAPGAIYGQASIFHPEGFICAHWSRAAYAEGGGPHGNWGAASGWMSVREGTQAHAVAEMLAAVCTHLQFSPGRLQ